MDFSRSSHGMNEQQPGDDLNASINDQELLRRLATSRAGGLQVGKDAGSFGMGGGGNVFAQGVGQNQFVSTTPTVGAGATGDARLSFMQQAHQADREEELLLQLLLARRRRQELQQDLQQEPERPQQGSFADDLLRLRQAGNAAAASSAATAAMFAADQEQQLHQLKHQQSGVGVMQSRFPPSSGLNIPPAAPFILQDQTSATSSNNLRPGAITTNTFATGRRIDDYILRTQQHQGQDSILMGLSGEQQRIEPSQSRFLLQQQASGLLELGNNRSFGEQLQMPGGDLEKMERSGEPASKKKRFHKKKPADMPRRPLSAYNLFFSNEREKILKEIDAKEGPDQKEGGEGDKLASDEAEQTKKPRALLRPLLPNQKKRRPHRKTHGKISFRLLAQMVGQRWKALPEDEKKYYQELAKEDMIRQKKAMEEYYLKQSEKVKTLDEDSASVKKEDAKGEDDTIGQQRLSL